MKLKFTAHQKKYLNKNAQYWVQTLMENEVAQCTGTLEDAEGFCCLGVGALCYQMKTGEELPENGGGEYDHGSLEDEFDPVMDWLGLHDGCGRPIDESDEIRALTNLNDQDKFTFPEIAEVLLQHPEAYFVPVKGK